jgi:hypothetical protein
LIFLVKEEVSTSAEVLDVGEVLEVWRESVK